MRTLLFPFLLVAAAGCNDAPPAPTSAAATTTAGIDLPAPAKRPVAKIVFVDKEHACECTQKAIDHTVAALNAVLAGSPLPVERLHLDTQAEQVEAFRKLRPVLALPALYLFDASGGLVEVVQGESDEAKLRAFLN